MKWLDNVTKAALVPVWLLTRVMLPWLPDGHPWKDHPQDLQDWLDKGTPTATILSVLIWLSVLILFRVLYL